MTTNSTGVKTTPITPPPPPGPKPIGSTATGLDALVDLITADPGLAAKIPLAEVYAGARFADQLDALIVEAIRATGVANNANLTAADLYDVNAWLRATHAADWVALHGNDEYKVETGFHLVQGDGATTVLYDRNAVNTVADGIYHLGFEICNGQLLNEDGNANARLTSVATWLSSLLANDLAAGTLANASVDPYVDGTTHTGLDQLVSIVTNDPGLSMKISNADLRAGASAADRMDALIVEAIRATGIANNGNITAADVYDLNAWLRANVPALWVELHGDDEDDAETGFHLVQNDGATTKLYGQNAVNTVADGLYHLGFEICDGQLLNEDGMANAKVGQVAKWLSDLLTLDLAAGTLANAAVDAYVDGTTHTGLDQLVAIVTNDAGLNMKLSNADIRAGATAADAMGGLIVEAIRATGVANNGNLTAADLYDVNAYLRSHAAAEWAVLHGDDEPDAETGFHLVQNDGATTKLYGQNAVDTVADGIYHLGFEICDGQLLNEDGDPNARLTQVAKWMSELLAPDLAAGTLANAAVDAYVDGTTHTGLDQLVSIVTNDPGLSMKISNADLRAGATAADAMDALIVEAIRATGVANNDDITAADVRDLNTYLRAHYKDAWVALHGDDEDDAETGFHLVQNDGATTKLYGQNAVDTVADGIYHLGFEICDGQLLNEDGMPNARIGQVAKWLSDLLAADLAAGTLDNAAFDPYVKGTTGTGLDQLVSIVTRDPGLNMKISTTEIHDGALAADRLDHLIVDAIRATGAADGGTIDVAEVRELNGWIRANRLAEWTALHGDDESDAETGFHLVQNDGATTALYGQNAVNTVADGIYHLGFEIMKGRVVNEDGDANASLSSLAGWLNQLLAADLAGGTLLAPAVALVGAAPADFSAAGLAFA